MELSSLAPHTALSSQFWPVAAQVIPVLALAIILEARTAIQRWPNEVYKLTRIISGVIWVTPLALFAVVENVAFQILAGRTRSTGTWVLLAEIAIIFSISALIVAPTLDLLLRSNAWVVVGGFFRVFSIISRRRIKRSLRSLDKTLARNRVNRLKDMPALLERIDAFEQGIRKSGDAESQETREILEAARSELLEIQAGLEEEQRILIDWRDLLQQQMMDMKKPDNELLKKIDQGLRLRGEFDPKEIKSLSRIKLPQDKLDDLSARIEALTKDMTLTSK
jgi:hypothetical protein